YSIVLSIGFMAAFPTVGAIVTSSGWRVAWTGIGWALILALTPLCFLFVRSTPEAAGLQPDSTTDDVTGPSDTALTLTQALSSTSVWAVGLCSAAYGLVASGIGLFNENILAELGLRPEIYHNSLAITAITSLVGNFLGGWLTNARPVGWQVRMTGVAMLLL